MNCLEARRALDAGPGPLTPELAEHLTECRACARHAAELERFEALLRRALEVPVPPVGAARSARPVRHFRRYALAASGVLAALLVATLWSFAPRAASA